VILHDGNEVHTNLRGDRKSSLSVTMVDPFQARKDRSASRLLRIMPLWFGLRCACRENLHTLTSLSRLSRDYKRSVSSILIGLFGGGIDLKA